MPRSIGRRLGGALVAACALGLVAPPVSTPARTVGRSLHVVVIGDSIPYGQHDCGGCHTFVELYSASAGRALGTRAIAENLAQHDNLTTARLLGELRHRARLRKAVAGADVVIISIGFNDTPWNAYDDSCDQDHGWPDGNAHADWTIYTGPCLATEAERYRRNLSGVYSQIASLRAGSPTIVRQVTQYNDFAGATRPPVPVASYGPTKVVVDRFVAVACQTARAHHARCADVYHAFNGADGRGAAGIGGRNLLAPDGTHPNAAGHALIARVLARLGYARARLV